MATTTHGVSTTLAVLANDGDPDPGDVLTVIATSATHGTVSINPDNSLSYTPPVGCGTTSDTVTYSIADAGGNAASASVAVSISNGPTLHVTPGTNGKFVGQISGPFSPASLAYTLSNPCGPAVSWTATADRTWFDVMPASGSLPAGQTAVVTVRPNVGANALTVANHTATLGFANTTNGLGTTSRQVVLEVHPAADILAAVLPVARSVQVGSAATAFATIINTSSHAAVGCAPEKPPSPVVPASFSYQTTSAANQLVGTPNMPATIAAGGAQSFVVALTPSSPIGNTELPIRFDCANSPVAPSFSGLNTLSFTASATPVPDMIAVALTLAGNGIVDVPGATGATVFAASAVNIGAPGVITAEVDYNGLTLPVTVTLCRTNPATGACLSPATPGPRATATLGTNVVATYSVYVTGNGAIAFDPARNRLFLRLKTADGITRGATSVAVRTQAASPAQDGAAR